MSSNKINKKITLPENKIQGKISLSGGLNREDIMKKMSLEKSRSGIITRKGEGAISTMESAPHLSSSEKERRIKAVSIDSNERAKDQKPEKIEISDPVEIMEDFEEMPVMETKSLDMTKGPKINKEILSEKVSLDKSSLARPEKKKAETETILLFRSTESSLEDQTETEKISDSSSTSVDKRDRTLINKILEDVPFKEFDDKEEIERLKENLAFRRLVEEQRQNLRTQENLQSFYTVTHDYEEEVGGVRRKNIYAQKPSRGTRRKNLSIKFSPKEIKIYNKNIVSEIAHDLGLKAQTLIAKLKALKVNVRNENDIIDGDTAELAIEEMGHTVIRMAEYTAEDKLKRDVIDENLQTIPPIVTIMGHVDHGKTSLLDALRKTSVASREAGGITQSIGAYQTTLSTGEKITFLDTPGHAAFKAIRERGANITHVAVIVIAADEGIMPQTIEAIKHIKAAKVGIVVAVNKIDKPGANLQKIQNELLAYEVVSEEHGGEVSFAFVSAKTGQGLEKLCEAILLQAEIRDIRGDVKAPASGVILEGKMDKQRGPFGNLLVQNGTLKIGDFAVVGSSYFKVRIMTNDIGENIQIAEPSTPVQVFGFSEVPLPGVVFNVTENEKLAKEIASHRKEKLNESTPPKPLLSKSQIDAFFLKKEGPKKINIIIRADAQSTIEAIKYGITDLNIPSELEVDVMQASVGNITEADIIFAKSYNAIIFSFNTKLSAKEAESARKNNIKVSEHSIIYHLLDEIKLLVESNLSPDILEEVIGEVEVRALFDIVGTGRIAGCIIKKGIARRNAIVKIIRKEGVIGEGKLKTLKRFKDDVKELGSGNECGIQVEGFENFIEGDILHVIERTEKRKTI